MSNERKSNTLLDTVNEKIEQLINDFQNNKVSRERFNLIYARYFRQLSLALSVSSDEDSMSTNAIQDGTISKARGLGIYQRESKGRLDTLGDFTLSSNDVAPFLQDLDTSPKIISYDADWLILLEGEFTIAILQYAREPDEENFPSLDRLMKDFERANQQLLKDELNDGDLAQPFICAIKSLNK